MAHSHINYVYPVKTPSSFNLVAKKHIEYLRKFYNITEIDQFLFPQIQINPSELTILHEPKEVLRIYEKERPNTSVNTVMQTQQILPEPLAWDIFFQRRRGTEQYNLIGFDVCDSDRMTKFAVDLINKVKKVAVPSTYCVDVFRDSGVKSKIYYVPHGVDREWYELSNVWNSDLKAKITNSQLLQLYELKKKGKKILLVWQWYDDNRKGYTEVAEVYKKLRKERNDVILVVKTAWPHLRLEDLLKDVEYILIREWLSDIEKIALYDIADATLLFSRHGAFEINGLESLSRGIPCLAHDAGAWVDYEDKHFLIKRGKKVKVFDNNPFHEGFGYTVDVDDAVAKINEVLDNLDEYKLIAEDHRQRLKEKFVWDKIAEDIVKMIED